MLKLPFHIGQDADSLRKWLLQELIARYTNYILHMYTCSNINGTFSSSSVCESFFSTGAINELVEEFRDTLNVDMTEKV